MNIWIVCPYAGSVRHGMNYRPYYFGREFARAGHRVVVVSGSYSHQFVRLPETTGTYTRETLDGMEYVWIKVPRYRSSGDPVRTLGWALFCLRVGGVARLGLPRPDAIVVSSPVPYPLVPAARLARRFGARLVFDVRDLWPLSLTALGGYSQRHPFIRLTQWVEDFACRRADLVVSALPNALEHMSSRGLDPGRFLWVSNGVDPGDAEAAEETDVGSIAGARPVASRDGEFHVCYAGSFHERNVALVFVEAADLLRKRGIGIRFHFLGKDGGGKPALQARARELGADNVVFHDPIPRSSMQGFLAGMDACLAGTKASPLYRFGISLTKQFDYMLAGKPVVLSSNAVGDIVSRTGCGLVVAPEDPGAAAEAIETLARMDPAAREEMGRRGREALLAEFTYPKLAARFLEGIQSAVDRGRSGPRG
ncbi:MAG TPA: glycosyltransferase family 4 protein [Spirochaetia bacterium]|nr:glycosyltransferase family 4 protein [Spirochaetales bacterium]HRY80421.1 glycosyltransferase family 4 protein [Spirochaetia bacterium]